MSKLEDIISDYLVTVPNSISNPNSAPNKTETLSEVYKKNERERR